jgi:hypothetical protein
MRSHSCGIFPALENARYGTGVVIMVNGAIDIAREPGTRLPGDDVKIRTHRRERV